MFYRILLLIILLTNQLPAFELELSPKTPKTYTYTLAICAIFQNEARWLKEWIEFHKLMGVQRFYLYNNLSTDEYRTVLQPYIDTGEVYLKDWPHKSINTEHWTEIQTNAYMHAIQKARIEKVKWLAILDTDEFLFPVLKDNLIDFLAEYDDYVGIAVNWQMYGTSFVPRIPSNQLMIEALTLKAPSDYGENVFVKSIVKPFAVKYISDPHHAHYKKGKEAVNSDRHQVLHSKSHHIIIDKIRINHYWSKDEEFFYNVKCPRRQKWQEGFDGQMARLNNLNQVEDRAIIRFAPKLRKQMNFDGANRLH